MFFRVLTTCVCNKNPPRHLSPSLPPTPTHYYERKTPLIRRFTYANAPPSFFGPPPPFIFELGERFFFLTQGSFLSWQALAVPARVHAPEHTYTRRLYKGGPVGEGTAACLFFQQPPAPDSCRYCSLSVDGRIEGGSWWWGWVTWATGGGWVGRCFGYQPGGQIDVQG